MDHRKKLFQTISCVLSLALLGSCAPDSEKTMDSTTLPKAESLPSYSENIETTSYSETIETTVPETSTEDSIVSSNSKEPDPIETQDDFSDIVELTYEQRMERLDQIAERALHTEIRNDMKIEEIISCLIDRYIICLNTYVGSSLFDLVADESGSWINITDQDKNIYHKIKFRYFNTLAEMEDFTKSTFTQSKAESWITISSAENTDTYIPRFIENEDGIYYCTPLYVISPSPVFYDNYIVEIKECIETECVFSYNANVDPKRYNQMLEAEGRMVWAESDFYHEGRIVLEDGEWKVDYVSPAAF